MRVKSYFADSVGDAMNRARTELGPDATLISSRRTEQDLSNLGNYEVLFGLPLEAGESLLQSLPKSSAGREPSSGADAVLRELAQLREQVDSFRYSVSRSSFLHDRQQLAPELAQIFEQLCHLGFTQETAQELVEAVAVRTKPHTDRSHRMVRDFRDLFARDLLKAVLEEEIASRFEVSPSLGTADSASKPVMFVGGSGSGKTTSLMKLGLQYGLKARRSVRLISLDTVRIGAWEHLNTYARISGADFLPLHSPSLLPDALSRESPRSLTLIDTPGFGKVSEDEAEELASVTRDLPLDIHLVVPAYATLAAAEQTLKRFAKFKPAKLLLTHTDSVDGCAPLVEFAMKTGLPLSFLGFGQRVPEDIRQADKAELTQKISPSLRAVSVAA